jgi:hypothetical protein
MPKKPTSPHKNEINTRKTEALLMHTITTISPIFSSNFPVYATQKGLESSKRRTETSFPQGRDCESHG